MNKTFSKSSDLFEVQRIRFVRLVHLDDQISTNRPLPALLRLDLYLLPILSRSGKLSKQFSVGEHARPISWQLISQSDLNFRGSFATAVDPVENLDSLDDDCFAVVNGNPWCTLIECVTIFI